MADAKTLQHWYDSQIAPVLTNLDTVASEIRVNAAAGRWQYALESAADGFVQARIGIDLIALKIIEGMTDAEIFDAWYRELLARGIENYITGAMIFDLWWSEALRRK